MTISVSNYRMPSEIPDNEFHRDLDDKKRILGLEIITVLIKLLFLKIIDNECVIVERCVRE